MEFTKQNEAVNEVFTCENENYKYTAEVVKTNDEIRYKLSTTKTLVLYV